MCWHSSQSHAYRSAWISGESSPLNTSTMTKRGDQNLEGKPAQLNSSLSNQQDFGQPKAWTLTVHTWWWFNSNHKTHRWIFTHGSALWMAAAVSRWWCTEAHITLFSVLWVQFGLFLSTFQPFSASQKGATWISSRNWITACAKGQFIPPIHKGRRGIAP